MIKTMRKKCLITGGGGFLGSNIAKALLDFDCEILIFARNKYPELEKLGIKGIQGDLRSPQSISDACKDVDTIFHTAAIPRMFGKKKLLYDVNVTGTENLLKAALENNVKKIVYTSSPSVVFGKDDLENVDETTPYPQKYLAYYPQTKADAEKIIISADSAKTANGSVLHTCAIRPHLIWGPGDQHLIPRLLEKARNGRLRQVGEGKNLVDLIYIDNAVQAHLLAGEKLGKGGIANGQVYFVSDAEPVNLWDWINILLKRVGLNSVKKRISLNFAYFLGMLFELCYALFCIDSEPPMTRFIALQLGKSHYFSNKKAERELGYKPKVSNEEGVAFLTKGREELN
ncbi:MAG: NAD-dependent epimerase/dehydratase family protein [Verrucomicrobiota bacterium]|nr:NAD-dependent epimerase/dehydratase family protein [Verrucomicrobiota bacterium]